VINISVLNIRLIDVGVYELIGIRGERGGEDLPWEFHRRRKYSSSNRR